MCRSCGSIIGAGEQQCAVCGASISGSSAARQPRSPADNETVRFARAVLNRPYKFTIVLLVANVFLFILMLQTSGSPFSLLEPLPTEVLLRFGAKLNLLHSDSTSMVALRHADVSSCQPAAFAGEHVQPLDCWALRRKTLWLGEVCFFLGGDWRSRRGCQLSHREATACRRCRWRVSFSKRTTILRPALRVRCLAWWACCLFLASSFVTNCRKVSSARLAPACCR